MSKQDDGLHKLVELNANKSFDNTSTRDDNRITSRMNSYHVVGPVSNGLVPRGRNTLLSVAVAEAASLHYQVVDGEVLSGKRLLRSGGGGDVFDLARARLSLQQPDSDVGDSKLLLALHPKRIQGLPLWERTVDHLGIRERDVKTPSP